VHRAYRILISPRVSLWLLVVWVLLCAVWVLPFTVAGQPEETIEAIALEWLPLRLVYGAVALALATCTVARAVRDWRRCASDRVPERRTTSDALARSLPVTFEVAECRLREARFEIVRAEHGSRAIRGRYRPLWGTVFHASMVFFAVALVLNASTTKSGGMELIEGQSAEEFFVSTPERETNEVFRPKLESLRLGTITPSFFREFLLFERLDATAEYNGEPRAFSLARPLWLDPVSYISIQDFNYAPRVTVTSVGGEVVDDVIQSMKLFPPGSEDTLAIPSAKIALTMQVFPDYELRDGVEVSRSYNMAEPRIRLTVFERVGGVTRQRVLARRTVGLGERVELPDGSGVIISEVRTVGTFRLVTAPWMPLVMLSGLLLVASLAGRLLWPRLDVVVWPDGEGVFIQARLDTIGRQAGQAAVARLIERTVNT
jgi:hypothetical protein